MDVWISWKKQRASVGIATLLQILKHASEPAGAIYLMVELVDVRSRYSVKCVSCL